MAEKYPNDVLLAAYARLRAEGDDEGCARLRKLCGATGNKYYVAPNTIAPATNLARMQKAGTLGAVLDAVQQGSKPMEPTKTFADGQPLDEVEHGHQQFQKTIQNNPEDAHSRAVYADWLEEHDPDSLHPEHGQQSLHFLRNHQGPAIVGHGGDGYIEAQPAHLFHGVAMPGDNHHPGQWAESYPSSYHYQGNGRLGTVLVSDGYVSHMKTLAPDESLQDALEDYASSYDTHGVPHEVYVRGTEYDPHGEEVGSDSHAFVTHLDN